MRVIIKNRHPQGKGRRRYLLGGEAPANIVSIGASGPNLPACTECVSVTVREGGTEYTDTLALHTITFEITDDGNKLDELIGKLTDLRAYQRRIFMEGK